MENLGTRYVKTFQKTIRGFRSSTEMFSYTIENMTTTVSLDVGKTSAYFYQEKSTHINLLLSFENRHRLAQASTLPGTGWYLLRRAHEHAIFCWDPLKQCNASLKCISAGEYCLPRKHRWVIRLMINKQKSIIVFTEQVIAKKVALGKKFYRKLQIFYRFLQNSVEF